MNRNKLKSYAPKARRAFIQAVTARASKFGITTSKIEPVQVQGDVALIGGQAYPRKVAEQRRKLEERIALRGFEQVMEEAAYTWFNRFAAIRFMEVHGYLDHGYRVLSHPEGKATPEIIEHAEHIDLPGLGRDKVISLKLDGTKDEELYRMLLTAQCNALHAAMPFLFELINDETELLLPDNLLHSDSLIRQMVSQIDESDWQEIEIIGWLYQFYISEKKDEVIGRVVKPEDIPAATQLFTPNWIVKYMVQNSLGAKWIAVYPQSGIRTKMEFYVETEEQSGDAKATLASVTPAALNPEKLTLIDPACGSGHILVEAYDLLKDIYLECGYSLREIPKLILTKNLFGLDIDDRATQLACFALMMKAREDDRRILTNPLHLNVLSIQASDHLNALELIRHLPGERRIELLPNSDLFSETIAQPTLAINTGSKLNRATVHSLVELFQRGKTLGSLIEVPSDLQSHLDILKSDIEGTTSANSLEGQLQLHSSATIASLMMQAEVLSRHYDCVVANPPYMGLKYITASIKEYAARASLKDHSADMFSMFIERWLRSQPTGTYFAFMTPFVWMYISSFERFRYSILARGSIRTLVQPEYHAFFDSAYVPICAFAIDTRSRQQIGEYFDLGKFYGAELQPVKLQEAVQNKSANWRYSVASSEFAALPGSPFAYSIPSELRNAFKKRRSLGSLASPRAGLATGDNTIFQRYWWEVAFDNIGFGVTSIDETKHRSEKWYPCNSGGPFRKWYGNNEIIVDWQHNGQRIRNFKDANGKLRSRPQNTEWFFREGITWTKITSSFFSARIKEAGFVFDDTGRSAFPIDMSWQKPLLGLLCSKVGGVFLSTLNPTMSYTSGDIGNVPVDDAVKSIDCSLVDRLIEMSKKDWDERETSWNFSSTALLGSKTTCLSQEIEAWNQERTNRIKETINLEESINQTLINLYNLNGKVDKNVDEAQVSLARPNPLSDVKQAMSYAIGCMLGRYSLAEPGLAYASSGNTGFDASRYGDFPADEDGIIPITETAWFSDDAANRFSEFLKVAWSLEALKENLRFVADSLGAKANETPMDTIRRYLSRDFYKDHLKTYKKRPIYWLFSSGKEKAFECLVYLHRYNESTLSRMRMEYVTPLQGRVSARIEQLDRDIQAASTTAAQKKLRVEQEKLKKQQAELIKFDEELRHYADKRIKLDLDDGVKVNYGKFGNLLAEVKTVTGGSDE
ncbi:BREX-1 system adenine-specific DNA-methyltransferase PglX [Azospirillum sp. TSH64]|uniref:BREX-1 system adenine-specific DNA-methyltransferase PglX n=1 Tax=Azospirillum sp. TSH64 TaxID=652740 RepID=UPI000D605E0C|nr:BREX-1 system adenine-specific DNA-methyltransferase PglX [Azospirillum sp. TSH64]PWC75518.1 hypothetical protein TSH64_11735 [Azospirillum sp. TSH64]